MLLRSLLVFALPDADAYCKPGWCVSVYFESDIDGVVELGKGRESHDGGELVASKGH